MDAYLHNDNKRCTMIFKGYGSLTFLLKEAKPLALYAKYDLQLRKNNWIQCDLRFDIKINKEKEITFKIFGKGENNGQTINIDSQR